MKTVAGCLHVSLTVAGLLAGLILYRIAARRIVEWLIEQPWFGKPVPVQSDHASELE